MADIKPLVIDAGQIQQMQPKHVIDVDTLPSPVDAETRGLLRSLIQSLVELGINLPTDLVEDAYKD